MKLICGIDPGLGGAIGFLNADGSYASVEDMPVVMGTTGRKGFDAASFAATLRCYAPSHAVVERVSARPGEGAVGAFSFGATYGGILAVLATLEIPTTLVQPAVWKRRAGIPAGADKAVSIAVAKRLIPSASCILTLKKHDGRAEALLLALHGQSRGVA
jgi:crossover junction endodeoxyribonuclease RuvC